MIVTWFRPPPAGNAAAARCRHRRAPTRRISGACARRLRGRRPVWMSRPRVMWVEYEEDTGRKAPDRLAVQVAGHFLKPAVESGLDGGREMHSHTLSQAMEHLNAVLAEYGEPSQQPITPWPEPVR